MLRDWFMPISTAIQVQWWDALGTVAMEIGGELVFCFSRVDKLSCSLGVPTSVGDVSRKLIRVLTNDYDIKQRTLFYHVETSRACIENIV